MAICRKWLDALPCIIALQAQLFRVSIAASEKCKFGALIFLMLAASGCDPMTGVVRTIRVKQLPSNESVEAALGEVPEIKKFELHHVPERKAFSVFEGKIREPAFSKFHYFTRNDMGVLQVKETKNGEKVIELSRISIGSTPKDVSDRNRALMDKIYASLLKHSPDLPAGTNMVEKLIRVREK